MPSSWAHVIFPKRNFLKFSSVKLSIGFGGSTYSISISPRSTALMTSSAVMFSISLSTSSRIACFSSSVRSSGFLPAAMSSSSFFDPPGLAGALAPFGLSLSFAIARIRGYNTPGKNRKTSDGAWVWRRGRCPVRRRLGTRGQERLAADGVDDALRRLVVLVDDLTQHVEHLRALIDQALQFHRLDV